MQRVLYWTGGHPYLTQRLCQAVAAGASLAGPPASPAVPPSRRLAVSQVDAVCHDLFLSPRARERDDNLLFVRERLLRSEADLASLMDLYAQVRSGKRLSPDDTNPLLDLLRLSGVVRLAEKRLVVRNRIYERVFGRRWVTEHMPDAELRRQRAAFRRGLLQATSIAALIVATMGLLTFRTAQSERRASRAELHERQQRLVTQRSLYAAQMNLACQAVDVGNVGRALALLEEQRPGPGQEDLRAFE